MNSIIEYLHLIFKNARTKTELTHTDFPSQMGIRIQLKIYNYTIDSSSKNL